MFLSELFSHCGVLSLENIAHKGHMGYSSLHEVHDSFDMITAFDVIEHLYDVPHFLEICKSKLSLGGYMVFLSGDIACNSSKLAKSDWWYVQYPEHIVFPSKKFFTYYSGLEILHWIPTYHTPTLRKSRLINIIKILFKIILRRYNGNPSLTPDHFLIILRKTTN